MLRLFSSSSFLITLFMVLILNACSDAQLASRHSLSRVNPKRTILVYSVDNYTDTPRAGMRAANIAEGILLSKGYRVKSRIDETTVPLRFSRKVAEAKRYGAKYLLAGGVSEWRYKTGIDGEPAVSLHLKLIDTESGAIVWSATGSDSSWGNTSIGVLAQELIDSMLSSDI